MGVAQIVPVIAALAVPALVARFGAAGTLSLASVISSGGLVALGTIPLLPVAGTAYMAAMSMSSIHSATRNLFSQQLVDSHWRTTTAAIVTVGVGLGWASSAVIGGVLVNAVGFAGLFAFTAGLAMIAGIIAWGYQRAARPRVAVVEVGIGRESTAPASTTRAPAGG
jgi:MFS family permease